MQVFKSIGRILTRLLVILTKVAFSLVLLILTLVVVLLAFFFASPEFTIGGESLRRLSAEYMPENMQIEFTDFNLELSRPNEMFFAKRLHLVTSDFCFRYEKEAVSTCFEKINFAATAGWGGPLRENESKWIPRLVQIEPIEILGGDVFVDLPALPESEEEEPEEEGGFNVANFLRTEIFPKWVIEGSRIEVNSFVIRTAPEAGYGGGFELVTAQKGELLRAELVNFRDMTGPLRAQAIVRILKPGGLLRDLPLGDGGKGAAQEPGDVAHPEGAWRIFAEAGIELDPTKKIDFKADADVHSWDNIDFRTASKFKGISALEEARLSGGLAKDKLDTTLSLKVGAIGDHLEFVNFINCGLTANLEQKLARLNCGPQSVQVQLKNRKSLPDPRLYVFYPEFDLNLTRLDFGSTKEVDFNLTVKADHLGLFGVGTSWVGSVQLPEEADMTYKVTGDFEFKIPGFQKFVKLVDRTPLAVAAPFNILDGPMNVRATAEVDEKGGKVNYESATRFSSSTGAAINVDFSGATQLNMADSEFSQSTDATLLIHQLTLAAPRFDLRAPPQLVPDGRFRTKEARLKALKKEAEAGGEVEPTNVRLRVRTTQPNSINIATNLTKAPIPITLDIVYDDRKRGGGRELIPKEPVDGASTVIGHTTGPVNIDEPEAEDEPPVTGWVQVGNTPIDLFRRNALLESFRVDLLKSGVQRLNGRVAINYLDYSIKVIVRGTAEQPRFEFTSDPVLDDNQILSVLLFGRPLEDLDEGERGSVSNLNAAAANAVLGVSSLYLLASTPIESIGYDPSRGIVTRFGLGGGATLEVGSGSGGGSPEVGFRKRISKEFVFRSDVETLTATGQQTVTALVEWVRRF